LINLLAIGGLAFSASSAHAGFLVSTATDCNTYELQEPFLRWLDPASYVLAPDGGFERRGQNWTLTGDARAVQRNESFYVQSRRDTKSLLLRPGSSATSPSMCVGIEYPTLRMFASSRRPTSILLVEVLFEDALGNIQSLPIATLTASMRWSPTIPMPVVANLLPLLPENRTAVAFRFTPQNATGDWWIDDVYVDPYRAR
jgi:hypothetical protein